MLGSVALGILIDESILSLQNMDSKVVEGDCSFLTVVKQMKQYHVHCNPEGRLDYQTQMVMSLYLSIWMAAI